MFGELKYSVAYALYNKFSSYLSFLGHGVFIPRYVNVKLRLHADNIKSSTDKADVDSLIYTVETKEHELNYLLNNRFLFGPARWVSLFKQKNLLYVDNAITINVYTYDELEYILKLIFWLQTSGLKDSIFPRIDTPLSIGKLITNMLDFVDVNTVLNKVISELSDNRYVYVLGLNEAKNVCLYKVRGSVLLGMLYEKNLYSLYGDIKSIKFKSISASLPLDITTLDSDNKAVDSNSSASDLPEENNDMFIINQDLVFCLDASLVENYSHKLVDTGMLLEDIGQTCVYGVNLHQDAKTVSCFWMYDTNLVNLLGPNYKLSLNPILPGFFGDSFYCLSDFVTGFGSNDITKHESLSGKYVASPKAFGLSLNLFGSNGHFIAMNTPWTSLEAGVSINLFDSTSKGAIISGLQDSVKTSFFSAGNTSLYNYVRSLNNFVIFKFLLYTSIFDSLFGHVYLQGFGGNNNAAIYHNYLGPFGFFNNVYSMTYDILINNFKLGDLSWILRQIIFNNTVLSMAKNNPLLLNNNVISKVGFGSYSESELDIIAAKMLEVGYGGSFSWWKLVSSFSNTLLKEILASAYLSLRHNFAKYGFVNLKYGLRRMRFTSILVGNSDNYSLLNSGIGDQMLHQVIFEPVCSNIAKYQSLIYDNAYFKIEVVGDDIIDNKTYVNSSLTCSYTQANHYGLVISSTPFLQRLYLHNLSFVFLASVYRHNVLLENNTSAVLIVSKQISDKSEVSLGLGVAQASHSGVSADMKIVYDFARPGLFLSQNFLYIMRDVDKWLDCNVNMLAFVAYTRILSSGRLVITGYCDGIVSSVDIKPFFDIEIKYTLQLLDLYVFKVGLVLTCSILRDNYAPIKLALI